MELHINEKLARQSLDDFFAEHDALDENDKEKQAEVLNRIINEVVMNAAFITPVVFPNGVETGEATFQLLRNDRDNTGFFPLFTNSDELAKWENAKGMQTVTLHFDEFAEMMNYREDLGGFVVNPFSDNFIADRRLVREWYEQKQMLVNGHTMHAITKDSKYEFHGLEPFPSHISDKLCETAKTLPEVTRVWLHGVVLEGIDSYLVVVELNGGGSETFKAIGESIKGILGAMPLHVVQFAEGFASEAVENISPIYTK